MAARVAQELGVDVNQIPAQGKRVTRADVETHVNRSQSARRVLASPKARRLADERNLVLAEIAGSGPDNAVLAADVLNFESVAVTAPSTADQTPSQTSTATPLITRNS